MESTVQPTRRTLIESVLSLQPYYALLIGLLPGFALIFGSIALHIDSFTAGPPYIAFKREVGYLSAVNWSITYAVLFPICLYLIAESLQHTAEALYRLRIHGMIRDERMQVLDAPCLAESWIRGTRARSWLLACFGGLFPALYSLVEWFLNNFLRLVHPEAATQYGLSDYDWGLAALMRPSSFADRLANAGFDLLAFFTQGALIGVSFGFFILMLDLGRLFPTARLGKGPFVIPDLKSADPRRGFEEFASPLQIMLAVSSVAYLICFLVRLEGVYMASTEFPNLWAFVQQDVLLGARHAGDPKSLTDSVWERLFNPDAYTTRGLLAWLLAVLVFLFSVTTVSMTVRTAAERAKVEALRWFDGPNPTSLFGDPIPIERERAASMIVWPLGYLSMNAMVIIIVVAVATLYLYRVGLFIAGFVVVTLLIKALLRLHRGGGNL